jgi:ceramide glucosyltransferase
MLAVFYLLVIEQILQGLYSLWQGMVWLSMARRSVAQSSSFYMPRVALLCPLKGLETGLEQNLLALTDFDYLPYEIFFSVASAQDPAYPLLERLAAKSVRKVHLITAGPAKDCTEKVNNLRAAVEQVGRDFDVLVFVDSDGRPPRRWLKRMVAPLADNGVGAATTFRWLIPSPVGKESAFWSALASAWNAPIATYMGASHRGATHSGAQDHNFCWGGGTAIRRERFEAIHAVEAWHGSASDDFSLTLALRNAGFGMTFVPECLVPSFTETSVRSFFEFIARQLIITRVYAPKLWATAAIAHLVYCSTVLLGLGLGIANLRSGSPSLQFFVVALIPPLLSAIRGVQRLAAVLELLPEHRQKLLANAWAWTLLPPAVPFVALYGSMLSAFRRRITWRGRRYDLTSARQTRVL